MPAHVMGMLISPGLSVFPSDLIVGDSDGVVAVPAASAQNVLTKAQSHLVREMKIRAENQAGTTDPERFNATLRQKGLPV